MEDKKKTVPVMAVKKALDLLEMLIFQDIGRNGIRLSDLADKLQVPDNTARNLLKTMIECGFVSQNSDSRYVVGEKCLQIGNLNKFSSGRIFNAINDALRHFNERINETVSFSVLSNGYRDVIAEAASRRTVRIVYEQASIVNIFTTATGRILSAYTSEDELSLIIERYGMPGKNWNNIRDIDSLKKELRQIQARGFDIFPTPDNEVYAFGCPVLDKESKLAGAIGCYAPQFRWPKEKHEEMINELKAAAAELSKIL